MKFTYNTIEYDIDDELSFKDFTGWTSFEQDFNNKVIYGSCFSSEVPDADIFGSIKGATFIVCNLDNVLIPPGNTVLGGSQIRFKAQNDLNDWIVDATDTPVKPIDYIQFEKAGLPMPLPEDIPSEKVDKPIDLVEEAKGK